MTVRSKQHGATPSVSKATAKVVTLPAQRSSTAGQSVSLRTRALSHDSQRGKSASLLSIRQHLNFVASIGIDDLVFLEQSYSPQVANKLLVSVRQLLDQEFGHLRVHRRRLVFVVNHHCMDLLIAGLLRVQYHAQQIPLPATRQGAGFSDVCGLPLSWGVGCSLPEAEDDRIHKRADKE